MHDSESEPGRDILTEAESLMSGDRRGQYGAPAVNFRNVATIWSVVLGHDVTPAEVCLCMGALKLVRASSGDKHRDSYVDAAAYFALAWEVS